MSLRAKGAPHSEAFGGRDMIEKEISVKLAKVWVISLLMLFICQNVFLLLILYPIWNGNGSFSNPFALFFIFIVILTGWLIPIYRPLIEPKTIMIINSKLHIKYRSGQKKVVSKKDIKRIRRIRDPFDKKAIYQIIFKNMRHVSLDYQSGRIIYKWYHAEEPNAES